MVDVSAVTTVEVDGNVSVCEPIFVKELSGAVEVVDAEDMVFEPVAANVVEKMVLIETLIEELIAHVPGALMVLLSKVTAPLRAKRLPSDITPVFTVIELCARMFPRNVEPVPKVAELPTCQKTLHSLPPLIKSTTEALPVARVDPIWKTQTALVLPPASRVRIPFSLAVLAKTYVPATRTKPPKFVPVKVGPGGRANAASYAPCAALCASTALASLM